MTKIYVQNHRSLFKIKREINEKRNEKKTFHLNESTCHNHNSKRFNLHDDTKVVQQFYINNQKYPFIIYWKVQKHSHIFRTFFYSHEIQKPVFEKSKCWKEKKVDESHVSYSDHRKCAKKNRIFIQSHWGLRLWSNQPKSILTPHSYFLAYVGLHNGYGMQQTKIDREIFTKKYQNMVKCSTFLNYFFCVLLCMTYLCFFANAFLPTYLEFTSFIHSWIL